MIKLLCVCVCVNGMSNLCNKNKERKKEHFMCFSDDGKSFYLIKAIHLKSSNHKSAVLLTKKENLNLFMKKQMKEMKESTLLNKNEQIKNETKPQCARRYTNNKYLHFKEMKRKKEKKSGKSYF